MEEITIKNYKSSSLYPKIVKTVGLLLQENDEIATVDILIKVCNLTLKDYDAWKRGKIIYFEQIFYGSLSKAGRFLRIINFHMHDLKMIKSTKTYKELNGKKILRFSKTGIKKIEEIYSRQFKWNRSQELKNQIIKESLSAKE